ncbi:family 78 glycoside hydrolase catalytic domain [Cohnella soli]|uniref:alpha-L-rhamnosidase n=1 Tax=Cohnella soli TaxID=425005 RepID=A0ABW0HQI1_9BACL
MLIATRLTVEYVENPLGIDRKQPGLGWQLQAAERNSRQTAYQIIVSRSEELLREDVGDVWDTGKVASDQSQHVIYEGAPLVAVTRYYWKVKAWDQHGREGAWSAHGFWETGLLEQAAWQAEWITGSFLPDPQPEPDMLRDIPVVWDSDAGPAERKEQLVRYFRFVFELDDQPLADAKLQIYAADAVHIHVNGQDEGLIFPYSQSVALDIIHWLQAGRNLVACRADGEKQGFIVAVYVTYADGRTKSFTTADGWTTTDLPGEDWISLSMDDGNWRPVAEIGKFGHGDWQSYNRILYPVNTAYGPNPVFGKTFRVEKKVARARLYISALGVYRSTLNGVPIGDELFAPGWTDYRKRIPYRVYDIAPYLAGGDNRIEVLVGSGWYAGNLSIMGPYHYGTKVACRAQMIIEYEDRSSSVLFSDETWQVAASPVVSADFYMGEKYDARLELLSPVWQSAVALDLLPGGAMKAQEGPPIRANRELAPKAITRRSDSVWLVDMGQNMVGWLRLQATGAAGTTIVIRYGERLSEEGELYRLNLRTAKSTDVYVMKGGQEEQYEPRFTYHGFQYAEIEGYPGELTADKVVGIVVGSELEEAGELHTSHPLVNRLLDNIRWSQRGNFFSVPLDCPQRDERLGWTGDAHVFARTATYNMNCASFYQKWLADIREAQQTSGAYTDIAPVLDYFGIGNVFFADAGVIIPWTMYKVYGDPRFIKDSYSSMKQYIAFLLADCDEELRRRSESYADHLSFGADTPKPLINAAFFAYSVKLMAEMAGIVGQAEDATYYADVFAKLKAAFQQQFVGDDGRLVSPTQTACVLALKIGLLPPETALAATQYLLEDIRSNGWHLTTGFMGVGYILSVLTEQGEIDAAFRLLLQETFPSWLFPVVNGATTIWERWDGWANDRGFQDPEMNSFNHYALGSVGEWLYRYLAGIDLADDAYGFRKFLIRPCPGGGFTEAKCRYQTLYGGIESAWELNDDAFTLHVEVPVNTTADITLPAWADSQVYMDGVELQPHRLQFQVGSGRYVFKVVFDSSKRLAVGTTT